MNPLLCAVPLNLATIAGPLDHLSAHEKVAELIGLPEDRCMGPMVAIGKGTKDPWPKPGQLDLRQVVVKNRFGA